MSTPPKQKKVAARKAMQLRDIKHLYRYEDRAVSVVIDAEQDYYGTDVEITLWQFPVIRYTKLGVWIETGGDNRRWVNLGPNIKKQFASPTKEEALNHFQARKRRQLSIYESRAEHIRNVLRRSHDWQKLHQLKPIKIGLVFIENEVA